MSKKHLDRYVTEFAGRHNAREFDTIDQIVFLARDMVRKKLPCKDNDQRQIGCMKNFFRTI